MSYKYFPQHQGLYYPTFEKDSCGVGFVCDIKGKKSNEVIENGIIALSRLAHRGAVGDDPKTGDGAGILIQIPHKFLVNECKKIGVTLPEPGHYATGMIFLPKNNDDQAVCRKIVEDIVAEEGQRFLGWRDVPVNKEVKS